MTGVTPFVYPGSRVLAGWWTDLARHKPGSIWIAHFFLHRVEALVKLREATPLDSLSVFVLKALALAQETSLAQLDQRLHLGQPLLSQVLRGLKGDRLVVAHPDGTCSLSAEGVHAAEQSVYERDRSERRIFYFAESEQPGRSQSYVPLTGTAAGVPRPANDLCVFDPATLQACLTRPVSWKTSHGFPLDVREIVRDDRRADARAVPGAWRSVIVDQPEYFVALLVLTSENEDDKLLAYGMRPEDWSLSREPVFALGSGWQDSLPDLTIEPSADEWRKAWRAWCHPRALPAPEVDACQLERQGVNLRVAAPARLVDRLRVSRSDAIKGEAWLLAGSGRMRTACHVDLVEKGRPG